VDQELNQALDFANYQASLAIQKKIFREKIEARLTYGHNGGLFKIDHTLLTFVQMLLDQGRVSGVPLLDSNGNPVLVDNLTQFRDDIFDRYFSSLLEYNQEYQQFKKKRSVEKLVKL
jgi:hypothetical protein